MRQVIDGLLVNYAEKGDTAAAEVTFPSNFIGFEGHFANQPVLPGICQMMLSLVMADRMRGRRQKVAAITNSKFISVVVPGQLLAVKCTLEGDKLISDISSGGQRVAQFKLKVEDA